MDTVNNKDQRREVRDQLIGDISWSYSPDTNENAFLEGSFVDETKSGMSILTLEPLKKGCLLKLYCKGRWIGARHATVMWCREVEPETYRSGLIISEV
jgi:hypothetical protein